MLLVVAHVVLQRTSSGDVVCLNARHNRSNLNKPERACEKGVLSRMLVVSSESTPRFGPLLVGQQAGRLFASFQLEVDVPVRRS